MRQAKKMKWNTEPRTTAFHIYGNLVYGNIRDQILGTD